MLVKYEPADYILEKAIAGQRISPLEALELHNSADFLRVIAAASDSLSAKGPCGGLGASDGNLP